MTKDQLTYIGTCIAAHGVKGEIQCAISNPVFDDFDTEYFIVEIDATYIPFYIEEYRWKSNTTLLVKFDNIDTLQATQKLLKHNIYIITPEEVGNTDDYYTLTNTDRLKGYIIKNRQDNIVGTIVNTDIISSENTILLLDNDIIIPLHPDLVINIDHPHKTITMTIPDGLIS